MADFFIWVVYDHPKDFPTKFVARKYNAETPTGNIILSDNLGELRNLIPEKYNTHLMRNYADDPTIMELWL